MTLDIRFQPLGGPLLTRDYLAGNARATRFYRHADPHRLQTYDEQLELVNARFDLATRQRLSGAFRPTSSAARERLERFIDHGGAVITTGQQVGLFTGPLLTIYKALTAVRLAAELEERLGRIVLPVFWCASEDHDWSEIDHTTVLDHQRRLVPLRVASQDPRPLPASRRLLEQDIDATVHNLRQALAAKDLGAAHIESVERAYRPGQTMGEAFASLLAELLAPLDMLLVDASHPVLKAISAPLLAAEVAHSHVRQGEMEARNRQLLEAGYHAQVSMTPGATNLFVETADGRERLDLRTSGRWATQHSRTEMRASDIDVAIGQSRVSPNALLRPVVESAVFPVLAYVGGPAEISYFAQSRSLFEAHGVPMPAVYPRVSCLLTSSPLHADLQRLGLSLEELEHPFEILQSRLTRDQLPGTVSEQIDALRRAIVHANDALIGVAATDDAALRSALGRRRNRMLLEVDAAERAVLSRTRERGAPLWRMLRLATGEVMPYSQPQERSLNVLGFLARDADLIRRILTAMPDPVHSA
jgi:bacillithiol synthase